MKKQYAVIEDKEKLVGIVEAESLRLATLKVMDSILEDEVIDESFTPEFFNGSIYYVALFEDIEILDGDIVHIKFNAPFEKIHCRSDTHIADIFDDQGSHQITHFPDDTPKIGIFAADNTPS